MKKLSSVEMKNIEGGLKYCFTQYSQGPIVWAFCNHTPYKKPTHRDEQMRQLKVYNTKNTYMTIWGN